MTEPDDTGTALPPERENAVRRLLGSVGDAPSLPPEVAARLDATLADLVTERAGDPGHVAPVVVLSARRRRAVAALFVAAAAVVVAGIGIPLVHDGSGARVSATSDRALTRTPTDTPRADSLAGATPLSKGLRKDLSGHRMTIQRYNVGEADEASAGGRATSLDSLGSHRLRTRLLALRAQVPPDTPYTDSTVHAGSGFTCASANFGQGYLMGARYAGAPAVVAFRAPVGSTQVAEVLQCGTARVLRSITLPTR